MPVTAAMHWISLEKQVICVNISIFLYNNFKSMQTDVNDEIKIKVDGNQRYCTGDCNPE